MYTVGPGTVSAAVLAGTRLDLPWALLAIACALFATAVGLLLIKLMFDHARERNARLIQRYVEITGRVSAIIVGSVAVEMILQGIEAWLEL